MALRGCQENAATPGASASAGEAQPSLSRRGLLIRKGSGRLLPVFSI
jgi:hypothetical protein